MKRNKIVVLIGESSSGKDSILNELVKRFGFHKAVSYTTRPMRDGEVDGKDYHFLNSNKQFNHLLNSGQMFEKTEYHTNEGLWLYGLGMDSFSDKCTNITIVNPHGLTQLMDNDKIRDRLVPFYITAPFEERFFRYLNRDSMSQSHKIELVDRFIRDSEDFDGVCDKFGLKPYNNSNDTNINDIVNEIEWRTWKSYE